MIYTKYKIKSHVGQVGDLAFEWDFDGSLRAKHEEFVKQAIEDGTYGQEFEIELNVIHNPIFDSKVENTKTSYKFIILDFNQ